MANEEIKSTTGNLEAELSEHVGASSVEMEIFNAAAHNFMRRGDEGGGLAYRKNNPPSGSPPSELALGGVRVLSEWRGRNTSVGEDTSIYSIAG